MPTRVLVPEQSSETVDDLDLDREEYIDSDQTESTETDNLSCQDDEEEEEEVVQVQPRKPRTKKVYPPSEQMFTQLIKAQCDLRELNRKIIILCRETEKCINRELRELRNQSKKQKTEQPKRKPRGFALPSPISHEMITYLLEVAEVTSVPRKIGGQEVGKIKIEFGCSLARNELTAALCQHFRASGMRKNDADHREIHLDQVTTQLFDINPETFAEEGGRVSSIGEPIITYFDLQKFLPRHCGKQSAGH